MHYLHSELPYYHLLALLIRYLSSICLIYIFHHLNYDLFIPFLFTLSTSIDFYSIAFNVLFPTISVFIRITHKIAHFISLNLNFFLPIIIFSMIFIVMYQTLLILIGKMILSLLILFLLSMNLTMLIDDNLWMLCIHIFRLRIFHYLLKTWI